MIKFDNRLEIFAGWSHNEPHTNTLFILDGPTLYNGIRVRACAIRVRLFHQHLTLIQEEK